MSSSPLSREPEAVTFTTYTVKVGPRWWQLRARFARWRLARRDRLWRKRTPPEVVDAADALERVIERKFLFGDEE